MGDANSSPGLVKRLRPVAPAGVDLVAPAALEAVRAEARVVAGRAGLGLRLGPGAGKLDPLGAQERREAGAVGGRDQRLAVLGEAHVERAAVEAVDLGGRRRAASASALTGPSADGLLECSVV